MSGGTWLGILRRTGKFAFLTNISDLLDSQLESGGISRGKLVSEFLLGNDNVERYLTRLKSNHLDEMKGYNLVIGQIPPASPSESGFHSNRKEVEEDSGQKGISVDQPIQNIQEGFQGLSNAIGFHNSSQWSKVEKGTKLLKECLKSTSCFERTEEVDHIHLAERIFELMSQTEELTEDLTENILIRPHHRLSNPNEKPNLQTWYATRTQTVILISELFNQVTFIERDGFVLEYQDDHQIGKPVWKGDDRNRWRVFKFTLHSSTASSF